MSTFSLSQLRDQLGNVVRAVGHTGQEAIITDSGKEIAVIVSMADYERLHQWEDLADAVRLRHVDTSNTMSLEAMLLQLGVSAEELMSGSAA